MDNINGKHMMPHICQDISKMSETPGEFSGNSSPIVLHRPGAISIIIQGLPQLIVQGWNLSIQGILVSPCVLRWG